MIDSDWVLRSELWSISWTVVDVESANVKPVDVDAKSSSVDSGKSDLFLDGVEGVLEEVRAGSQNGLMDMDIFLFRSNENSNWAGTEPEAISWLTCMSAEGAYDEDVTVLTRLRSQK